MNVNMTEDQAKHVLKYQDLYNRLSIVESKMADLKDTMESLKEEAGALIIELENLRKEEDKLFQK